MKDCRSQRKFSQVSTHNDSDESGVLTSSGCVGGLVAGRGPGAQRVVVGVDQQRQGEEENLE